MFATGFLLNLGQRHVNQKATSANFIYDNELSMGNSWFLKWQIIDKRDRTGSLLNLDRKFKTGQEDTGVQKFLRR